LDSRASIRSNMGISFDLTVTDVAALMAAETGSSSAAKTPLIFEVFKTVGISKLVVGSVTRQG
jgi:hypothetical protein